VDNDTQSPFYHLLFSTFFKPLINYNLIVEDMDNSKFTTAFQSLRGDKLIMALEKEGIVSKEDFTSFLFSKN
jgi:hypothetical protein